MIQISKEEAMALRAKFGSDLGITITSRNKKGNRKKYYTEEAYRALIFLERFREKQAKKVKRGSR